MSARDFWGDWDLVARIIDAGGTIKPPVLPAEPQVFTFAGGPSSGEPVHVALAHVVPPVDAAEEPDLHHTIACDNTDRELCDCADTPTPPPEPNR